MERGIDFCRCPECRTITNQFIADSFLRPDKHTFEIAVFTGDFFIHKRTGIEYVFYHDKLGTRIERVKD